MLSNVKKLINRPWFRITLALTPLIILIAFFSITFFTTSMGYDDSYNLQVPVNLSTSGDYATNGGQFTGEPKLFDPYISTGPTLLVPIALAFKTFGIGVWQYRLVTGLVFLAFMLLIVLTIREATKKSKNNLFLVYSMAGIAAALIIGLDAHNVFISAMGEIMALAFMLASYMFISRKYYSWAGLMLGLAVLTKTIFFIAVPFFMISVLVDLRGNELKQKIKTLLYSFFAIFLPSIVFELYRFASLNFQLAAYKTNIRETILFFKTGGSGAGENSTILSLLEQKLRVIANVSPAYDTKFIRMFLLALSIFVAIFVVRSIIRVYWHYRNHELLNNPLLIFFGGTVALWIFWWAIISDNSRERHIMPAIAISIIMVIVLLLLRKPPTNDRRLKATGVMVFMVLVATCLQVGRSTHKPYYSQLTNQVRDATLIQQAYGEIPMYHFGWWQNPEIQFLNKKRSYLYNDQQSPENQLITQQEYWVLMSTLHMYLAKISYDYDIGLCTEVKKISDTYQICVIRIPEEKAATPSEN